MRGSGVKRHFNCDEAQPLPAVFNTIRQLPAFYSVIEEIVEGFVEGFWPSVVSNKHLGSSATALPRACSY
jgi:hypothetical protein